MTAQIIDGSAVAKEIRAGVARDIAARVAEGKSVPGLATVLVGEDTASQVYVKSKHKACQEAGIRSFGYNLPASTTQQEVEDLIRKLNDDPEVSGILVQLPLPRGLDEQKILNLVRMDKDVDGFHPLKYWAPGTKGT